MAATYLDRILAAHREAATVDRRSLVDLRARAGDCPPPRDFASGVGRPGLGVIAEVKRASPSRGPIAPDLEPGTLAAAYEAGGASCVSVLTDREFFSGSPEDLVAARAGTSLPVLRKDFTVSAADVHDARIMGADAVLLIVAALGRLELEELHGTAIDLGLTALVEVHDEPEAQRALEIGAGVIGVNQRDLVTFSVDTDRAVRVGRQLPDDVLRVAESGIERPSDLAVLQTAGFDAVLVGESLVRSADPRAAVAAMVEAGAN